MFKKTLMIDLDGVLNEYDGKFDEKVIPNLRGLEIVLSSSLSFLRHPPAVIPAFANRAHFIPPVHDFARGCRVSKQTLQFK